MITKLDLNAQTIPLQPWQNALKSAVTEMDTLLGLLELEPKKLGISYNNQFPLRVPHSFIDRMEKKNPDCPLLKQVLPLLAEKTITPGFSSDPLQEANYNPVPGLLHKFEGRVLITLTKACAVHCRYCFRQHFPYENNRISDTEFEQIVEYLKSHPKIKEIILSGGDPLSLKDAHLQKWMKALYDLPQIELIRFHTRFLVMIPSRITQEFCNLLESSPKKMVIVLHINHPNEINDEVADFLSLLPKNVSLLNQSVLLRGVNDNASVLAELSYKLIRHHILPYYLHQLDRVQGTAHFECPPNEAKIILSELSSKLPGYLVPKYVQEIPGFSSKQLIDYGSA